MKPGLYLLIGAVSVSFAAIFIRLADAPPLIIAAYRIGIASLIILPFTWKKVVYAVRTISKNTFGLLVLAGVFLSAHFYWWITSLEYTTVASSVVLVTANPIFIGLASYLLWKEKLGRRSILGIMVAIAGVVVINFDKVSFSSEAFYGNMLALVAGLMAGGYLLIARVLRDKINAIAYLSLVYAISAVILVISAIVSGLEFTGYSTQTFLMFILLAIIPQILGHSSFNLAARLMSVTLVSIAILGEPVGATILGILILGEQPAIQEIIGGVVILLGIYLVLNRKTEPQALVDN
ncbi:MAG: DMT family transporter [Dehalogenimonas sp.]|uniref:DMT family transporter n=1 Tax=Candidatus Dehalogenimonas loeffleri TaxID=3127115 RepID=A0ABZ2J2H1_9CHLR|nr:DMT family transporter [Dehalogenimonas sp.]